jgi:hypothetical protein
MIGALQGSRVVAEYRIYIVGQDGHFVRGLDLVCPDDKSAREYAKNLVDGHDVELWKGERPIAKFRHKSE